jgi:hypothetical protein
MKQKISYGYKPAKFSRDLDRELLKGYYKSQRYGDRAVGKKIDSLFKRFHEEFKKKKEERSVEMLKVLAEEITSLRKQKLFRHDFPTVASFKAFMKKEKITLKDLVSE